jgi:hypothetical protein
MKLLKLLAILALLLPSIAAAQALRVSSQGENQSIALTPQGASAGTFDIGNYNLTHSILENGSHKINGVINVKNSTDAARDYDIQLLYPVPTPAKFAPSGLLAITVNHSANGGVLRCKDGAAFLFTPSLDFLPHPQAWFYCPFSMTAGGGPATTSTSNTLAPTTSANVISRTIGMIGAINLSDGENLKLQLNVTYTVN